MDEPVSLPQWRRDRLSPHMHTIALRVERGETLRAIGMEYGVSHETLRQALKRNGYLTRPPTVPASSPRLGRMHRLPGRGRSTALAPEEVTALLARHHAGESIRSLAHSVVVSHETIRRVLANVHTSARKCVTA